MIKISLPNPTEYDIKMFFRQMELSIHHAQKAWEEIEKDAKENPDEYAENWRENYYVMYRFPRIELYDREQDNDGNVKVHVDEEGDQMQNIEIEISC